MTKSYAQLKSAIAKLEKEAAALREAEMTKVIAQIKESIATFGLTVEHLFGRGAKALKVAAGKTLGGGKAPRKGAGIPKYRHPKTGKTWTGFGKAPGWIATARNRDKFLIAHLASLRHLRSKASTRRSRPSRKNHPQGPPCRTGEKVDSRQEGRAKEECSFEEGCAGTQGSCCAQGPKGRRRDPPTARVHESFGACVARRLGRTTASAS